MGRDAAVALACDTHRQCNQFARLRVEPRGLGAGVTQIPIAPHGLRAEPAEIVNRLQQFRDTDSNRASSSTVFHASCLCELSESPKRIPVIVDSANHSF